jgi:hypothetical protein
MSEAVLDVAALDASASTVDADIPSLDSMPEVSAEEVPAIPTEEAGADKTTKTEDGQLAADKNGASDVSTASAALTPKAIVEKLSEIKKTDPALATRLHAEVKNSLELKHFLKTEGIQTLSELKTKLSAPDETVEQIRQSVQNTDSMLYEGGDAHKELVDNILADLESNIGDKAGARLSELAENIITKLAEADPTGSTRIQRAAFLAASESSGLIKSLNQLHVYLAAGKTDDAKNLLASIGKFYSEELKQNGDVAKLRETAKAAAEKETTATVTKLRAESEVSVDKSMNVILGGFLSPFLKNALKGTPRPELESLAAQIKAEAKSALGKDATYVAEISKLYRGMKTPADKAKLDHKFEAALKHNDFGKKLVERVCREKFPEKFAVKPAPAPKPTTVPTTINGKSADAYVFKARPTNLLHEDIVWKGQQLTSRDLSTLQATRQQGFVKLKTGQPVLVTWKAKV